MIILLWLTVHFMVSIGGIPPSDPCRSFYGDGLDSFSAFSSPSYPSPYPPNTDCVRVIQSRPGYDVAVKFNFFFQIEGSYEVSGTTISSIRDCPNDFVEFRDGRYGFSPLLGRFCGNDLPKEEIRAKSGYLWVRFHSDEILEYKGFHATYEMVKSLEKKQQPQDCHFEYHNSLDGYLETRGLDNLLMHNSSSGLQCVWRVEVPSDVFIVLYVERFDLAAPNQCNENYFEVYSGTTGDTPIRRYCGLTASNVFTLSNVMFIRYFVSNRNLLRTTHIRALYSTYARHKNCTSFKMFTCGDENCVPQSLVCNHKVNCPYGRDEQYCTVAADAVVEFLSSGYAPLVFLIVIVFFCVLLIYIWTFGISSCLRNKEENSSSYPPTKLVNGQTPTTPLGPIGP